MRRRMPLHRAATRPATASNPLAIALRYARRLTHGERQAHLAPVHAAHSAMRAGVANLQDWMVLATAMNVGDAIETLGVVRGVGGHIARADLALYALHQRTQPGERYPVPTLEELDDLQTGVQMYAYQVTQLSVGELLRAQDLATNQTRSTGGLVVAPRPSLAATPA